MTIAAMEERVTTFLTFDWMGEAEGIIAEMEEEKRKEVSQSRRISLFRWLIRFVECCSSPTCCDLLLSPLFSSRKDLVPYLSYILPATTGFMASSHPKRYITFKPSALFLYENHHVP